MKRLLLLMAAVVLGLSAYGQQYIHSWRELDGRGDSADFVFNYGSVKEWNYQHQIFLKDGGTTRIWFIDAKYGYVLNVIRYLSGINICGNAAKISGDPSHIKLTVKGCKMETENGSGFSPVIIDVFLNKDNRMQRVVISGAGQQLLPLFVGFWELSLQQSLSLGKGSKRTITSWDDKITFDWTKPQAQIRITRNGNLHNYRKELIDTQ